jgi:hypothetical protein
VAGSSWTKEVAKAVELRNIAVAVTTVLVKLMRDFITPLSHRIKWFASTSNE